MRQQTKKRIASIIAGVVLTIGTSVSHAQLARYSVTFTGTWSANDIRSPYPASAHFSPMIGVTHQEDEQFWRNGGQAGAGVELVAELGANGTLKAELLAAQGSGTVGEIIEFQDLFDLPNSDTVEIEVADDKPFITLITMIAPSPDWFIGVSGLPLTSEGKWLETLSVGLRPYDAGTEEGNTFSLSNPPSPASARISRLRDGESPFIGTPVIGRLEFTLLNPSEVIPPDTPPIAPPSDPPAPPPSSGSKTTTLTAALLGLLFDD